MTLRGEPPTVANPPAVKCLVCGGDMGVKEMEGKNVFLCQNNQAHRMTLSEWIESRQDRLAKERIKTVMTERSKKK